MYSVFIIDDEPLMRRGLAHMINRAERPFSIVGCADDGGTAMPLLRELRPDVIFTDIRMEHMGGLELAAIVKQELPDTIVIIISGYDSFQYAKEAIEQQVFAYLLKPINYDDIDTLLDKLSSTLDGRRQIAEDRNFAILHRSGVISAMYSLLKQKELPLKIETQQLSELDGIILAFFHTMNQKALTMEQKCLLVEDYLSYLIKSISILSEEKRQILSEKNKVKLDRTQMVDDAALEKAFSDRVKEISAAACSGGGWSSENTIKKIQRYIDAHYPEQISLSMLSQQFGLNPYYLSTIFKKYAGVNFSDYISQVRIRRSLELMKDSNLKVVEIASKVGYESSKSFSRTFKKIMGVNPEEFRREGK